MIKFFRHIRKSLIEENRMGKYFKYAIGEIILVVIGILIALQINNWNEKRNINAKNAIIIQNLNDEFKDNLAQLNYDSKRLDDIINACEEILVLINPNEPQITSDEFELLLSKTFGTPNWSSSSFVLEELKNSGALTQLNNNALKKLLFQWEREFSKTQVVRNYYDDYGAEYIEFIVKYGSVRNLDAIPKSIENLEKSTITENPISFLKNPVFENRLENFYFLAFRLKNKYAELATVMNNIIEATKIND